MKAVRFHGVKDVRVEEVEAPAELGRGQVLLRPIYCGICGTDLHEYLDGPHWVPEGTNAYGGAKIPQILGHEFSAEVVETGMDVTTLKAGDRVSIQPQIGPPESYFGRKGRFQFGRVGANIGLSWPWGGMADLAVVNDYNAIVLPDDVSNEQGALIEPAAVAVQAIDLARIRPGDSVLITGGGPIGALAAMAANVAGASRIIVSEPSPGRRARLEALSVATHIVDPTQDGFLDAIRSKTIEEIGVDAAIECSGNPRAFQQCIDAVRPLGTVVMAGLIHGGMNVDLFEWVLKGLNVRGSLAYSANGWPRIMEMIRSGKFPVEKLIDGKIRSDNVVKDGFQRLLDPEQSLLKILVRP